MGNGSTTKGPERRLDGLRDHRACGGNLSHPIPKVNYTQNMNERRNYATPICGIYI
jgi:hypothetical protein